VTGSLAVQPFDILLGTGTLFWRLSQFEEQWDRQTMAGVERALIGMKVGGYRKVRVSPHLAYRDKGISDLIPPEAVLIVELWLRGIVNQKHVDATK
jgi:hypothetical protein